MLTLRKGDVPLNDFFFIANLVNIYEFLNVRGVSKDILYFAFYFMNYSIKNKGKRINMKTIIQGPRG